MKINLTILLLIILLLMPRCTTIWLHQNSSDEAHTETSLPASLWLSLDYTKAGILSYLGDTDAQVDNSEYLLIFERDKTIGIKWLRKASEQGNPKGQYLLCTYYACGHFVPQDRAEAFSLCRKSANQGYVQAQAFLSDEYNNMGNTEEALKWINAAKSGLGSETEMEKNIIKAEISIGVNTAKQCRNKSKTP